MTNRHIITNALANGLLTVLYVNLIGQFFANAQAMFGDGHTPFIPIAMLLLFVFSATVCGSLVLGRPILWYLDGNKKEAVTLFGYTLAVIFVAMVLTFIMLYLVTR